MSVIDVHALANDSNENHSVITNKNEKIDIDNLPLILKIEDAGKVAGLNRHSSYNAAKNGSMPTIRIGGRKWVPTKKWLAILNGDV